MMMSQNHKMTTISIAMATYNGASFIREQLDSLAAQIVLPCELVVADDGSTDETLEIIADFSLTAPFPVHLYRNAQRLQYRANFMQCASRCSGDLIAFCDQDDIWDRDKLATVVQQFENVAVDLIYHDLRLMDANGSLAMSPGPELVPLSIDQWTVIRGLTQVFRRTLMKYSDLWKISVDHLNPDECLAHDQWFVFLAYSFNSIHHLSKPLLSYRLHATNLYGIRDSHLESSEKTNLAVIALALFGRCDLARARRTILCKHLLRYGLASKSRLDVLKEIYQRERSICEPHFSKQLDFYSTLANSYIPRASIYEHTRIAARLTSFFYALKGRAYNLNLRGLKGALIDIIFGVFLSPTLEPLTLPSNSESPAPGHFDPDAVETPEQRIVYRRAFGRES
jgi:glycosyltransferase involved in cell wall biosynthesis